MQAGLDVVVAVEHAEPDADRLSVLGSGKQRRAAVTAEALLGAVGRLPGADAVLTAHDPEGGGVNSGVACGGCAGPALAPSAMAVRRRLRRFGDLELHRAAVARSRQHRHAAGSASSYEGSSCQKFTGSFLSENHCFGRHVRRQAALSGVMARVQ